MIQMFKELFKGKYDGNSPATLLPVGSLTDGKNVRKVGELGGWKTRKGNTLHHTTQISARAIDALIQYTHPRNGDYHFFAQMNSLIYKATNNPIATGTTFGTSVGVVSGTTPVFWDVIREHLFLGDGEGGPLVWGGDSPFCSGFLAKFDIGGSGADTYVDFTRKTTDNRTDTYATLHDDADDELYVCSPEPAKGINFDLGSVVNAKSVTATVKAWRAGAWAELTVADDTKANATPVAIEDLSVANPCVVTWTGHGMVNGQTAVIAGITQADWTALNGDNVITYIDANSFSVAVDTSGFAAYVPGTDPGTITFAVTLAQDGNMTWTEGADEMKVLEGYMGYWYQITLDAALTSAVRVRKCQVQFDMTRMTNKWNGVYEWIGACRLYDGTEYQDYTGKVTNESTSVYMDIGAEGISSFVYVKAAEPITGIGFGITAGYENALNAQIDLIEYWDGDSWNNAGTFDDGTYDGTDSSFVHSGTVVWDASGKIVERRTFDWDSIPGYWYRVSWDATLTDEVRIWGINYIPFPEELAPTDGCIDFKGRNLTWGDSEYPNRLRFSAKDRPDCFCGTDSGYTEQMGNMDPILTVRKFHNELLVWKKNEVYLLEGYSPETFGSLRVSTTVGIASPQTAHVVETGSPTMHRNEPLSIAIWQEVDGIYALDGRKPRKVSMPIDDYFNPEKANAIDATEIRNRQAFLDKNNNEYHLLLGGGELVYNYLTDEWYPSWERYEDITCGLLLRGTNDRWYNYAGLGDGYVVRLEDGLVDKDTSNTSQNIAASIKTRVISTIQDKSPTNKMTFRKNWIEAKALASGSLVTKIYPDLASSGTTLATPQAMSLVRSGYSLAQPGLETSQEGINCFQLEYLSDGLDFEIHSMLYQLDARGELSVV
ncbi:MAG: hypothetical protein DRN30_00915 [Thermoplasmata archaeon]|nr:MAG: hypothetical protein DRN30_00915 [Thermoplasmata archaeon]